MNAAKIKELPGNMLNKSPLSNYFKYHRGILLVILAYVLIGQAKCRPMLLGWDAADYVLMGKYIFSLGKEGYWVSYRGPVWAIILGFLWRIGLDPVEAGRWLEFVLSAAVLFLLYTIASHFFSRKSAVLAAFFLGFSPLYFVWSKMLYADIPAVFFSLSALALFLKNRPWGAGLATGLAFLTRFDQGVLFFAFLIAGFGGIFYPRNFRKIGILAAGFILSLVPYLVFNSRYYGDILFPFKIGAAFFRAPLEGYYAGRMFYVLEMFKQDFFWILFYSAGIYATIKGRNRQQLFFFLLGSLYFLFYEFFPVSQDRYLIEFLPMFYVVAAYGWERVNAGLKSLFLKNAMALVLGMIVVASLAKASFYRFPQGSLSPFQKYALSVKGPFKGEVWITHPAQAVYGHLKVDRSLYDIRHIVTLKDKIKNAGLVFFEPQGIFFSERDAKAPFELIDFFESLKKELHVDVLTTDSQGNVQAAILRRI